MSKLPPEVLARIERAAREHAEHISISGPDRFNADLHRGYKAGAIKEAERAAELVAFLERWKTYNIEAEEEEQNKYDSELENVLSHYRGETL
jgi:hypothetical protein